MKYAVYYKGDDGGLRWLTTAENMLHLFSEHGKALAMAQTMRGHYPGAGVSVVGLAEQDKADDIALGFEMLKDLPAEVEVNLWDGRMEDGDYSYSLRVTFPPYFEGCATLTFWTNGSDSSFIVNDDTENCGAMLDDERVFLIHLLTQHCFAICDRWYEAGNPVYWQETGRLMIDGDPAPPETEKAARQIRAEKAQGSLF